MAMSSTKIATSTAKAVPAKPTAAKPEDEQQQEGESIDIFSHDYHPTALPPSVLACFCKKDNHNHDPTTTLTIPSHTSRACESALLSSVSAPLVVHPEQTASCIESLLKKGQLSPLQAEGVLLAIQRHRRILSNGERAGFFLGDGAGIGKGRQIAAILRDSFIRSGISRRHIWMSVSRELIQDARRDLRDVGVQCEVYDGTQILSNKGSGLGRANKGVMFLTYNLLISCNRLEQIIEWLADTTLKKKNAKQIEKEFNGVLILDEAHKAKNLVDDTKTAKLVLQLQRRLPRARVVYASATGVSDVNHLAYAERLGLWSTNISHFDSFEAFRNSLKSRGLGSLEQLALELKLQGSFLARTLSWEGSETGTVKVDLTPSQIQTYNRASKWWRRAKIKLEQAISLTGAPPTVWRNFWSAHLRFFKELGICFKVPFIARDAQEQVLKHDRCVIIGLQSTGEAGMQSLLDTKHNGKQLEEERFDTLLSTCSRILLNFIQKNFRTTPQPPSQPKLPDPPSANASLSERQEYAQIKAEIARIDALPPPDPVPQLVESKQALLNEVDQLALPPNPLDHLIDALGGVDQVAEMTGRQMRMIRHKKYFTYSKRAEGNSTCAANAQDDSDRINLKERKAFQDGKKRFAIISDAASTGISLHAARGTPGSHRRRVHYTIELPWSADKAVQQLGRSHRSGQESAPIYKLVTTTLGGESRFAAAVSKRMSRLGALTKGDRRAATRSDLSDFDLDTKYGKRALKKFYTALGHNEIHHAGPQAEQTTLPTACLPSSETKHFLDDFVQELQEAKDPMASSLPSEPGPKHSFILAAVVTHELAQVGLDFKDKADVRVFLNRLAGLQVDAQTLVFNIFMSCLDDVIKEAKATGEFEGTAEDIVATTIELQREVDLAVDPFSKVVTKLVTLSCDRGISFEAASAMAVEQANKEKKLKKGAENEEERGGDEDEDDEWLSAKKSDRTVAKAGFYISKAKIAGRHLILFAKCKYDDLFDPMGLMLVTRPNTGRTAEMSSRDLERKYRLALGCEELKDQLSSVPQGDVPAEIVKKTCTQVAKMWDATYKESDNYKHKDGLAPRRQTVSLVTGPVLHIMSAMEKAVMFLSEKDRNLRIMRADIVDSDRIVGVRFPSDNESISNLQQELLKLEEARKSAGEAFKDEQVMPVCNKSLQWTTKERPTIKSFFQAKAPTAAAASGKNQSATKTVTQASKRSRPAPKLSSNKKAKKLTSFFSKK